MRLLHRRGQLQIAFEAPREHVQSCRAKGENQFVYSVFVNERFRRRPLKRIAMSRPIERWVKLAEFMPIEAKPEWYRAEDYTPWEGEQWSGTYQGEDDERSRRKRGGGISRMILVVIAPSCVRICREKQCQLLSAPMNNEVGDTGRAGLIHGAS
ncbi:hypothetical protein DAEQUDRAFT_514223 [Daedalea quercina L-15889]|uniref:Uncharacterized protein n=1 Tax=Daedalea quercina L-15889 TaxID=1314783 RepID=A0A165MI11_9APHY|nr:hypothetical protein DAEQUDRAFT_514223 [Daedalea quercina L-15889]